MVKYRVQVVINMKINLQMLLLNQQDWISQKRSAPTLIGLQNKGLIRMVPVIVLGVI